ncbi:MAG: helix-turn-helix domain-containing protein [Planctomycetota bacterium]|jgi:excisionase family DNA binding protein
MSKGKNVLTTGDVAKICNVAPRTVSKWFDSGQLKGYRIPGSKDRRIPVSELIRFMKVHNMPATTLPAGKIRVLIVDSNGDTGSALADILRTKADYEVQTVRSNFETGIIAQKFAPHVLLISLLAGGIDATGICKSIRANEDLQAIKVIALANQLSDSESAALLQKGFDSCISNPADVTEIVNKIEEATAIIY